MVFLSIWRHLATILCIAAQWTNVIGSYLHRVWHRNVIIFVWTDVRKMRDAIFKTARLGNVIDYVLDKPATVCQTFPPRALME